MKSYDIIQLDPIWARVNLYSKWLNTLRSELGYKKVYWTSSIFGNKKKNVEWVSCISKNGFFGAGLIWEIEKRWPDIKIKKFSFDRKLFPISVSVKLRDYQIRMVVKALKATRGILYAPTGSGKTVMGAALASTVNNCVFIVHTKALLEQNSKELEKLLREEVGIFGTGKREVKRITVCMIQTLSNLTRKEFKDYNFDKFEMVIVDEAHHAHSSSYQEILKKFKSFYRYGLTATPHELWTKEEYMKVTALLGPIVAKVSYQELEEEGYVACPIVCICNILHKKENKNWNSIYRNWIVRNYERNRLVAEIAKKLASCNKSVLIQVALIEHGEEIKKFLEEAELVKGSTPDEVQLNIKEALKQKKTKIVISTTVWKEGVDIPSLDCVINATGKKSRISTIQSVGRALRPKEGKAIIIDFMDRNQKYLEEHSFERLKIYKSLGWEIRNWKIFEKSLQNNYNNNRKEVNYA